MQEQIFAGYGQPRDIRRSRKQRDYDNHRNQKRHKRYCSVCCALFIGRNTAEYCSDLCRMVQAETLWLDKHTEFWWPSCEVKWRTCCACQTPYIRQSYGAGERICSERCRLTQQQKHWAKWTDLRRHRIFTAGPCSECGASFVGVNADRYCSEACARRSTGRIHKNRRSKRIKNGLRRDPIGLPTLAKRDNWRCHICRGKVDRTNWSVDHLIPLSQQGLHVWENVALAHFSCNTKRGTQGAVQLRLTP